MVKVISDEDFLDLYGTCKDCGSSVFIYLCNGDLIFKRPGAEGWDRWVACINPMCDHWDGEGHFQTDIEWCNVYRKNKHG